MGRGGTGAVDGGGAAAGGHRGGRPDVDGRQPRARCVGGARGMTEVGSFATCVLVMNFWICEASRNLPSFRVSSDFRNSQILKTF